MTNNEMPTKDAMRAQLNALTKPIIVDMVRAIEGSAGDYARISKDEFIERLLAYDVDVLQQAQFEAEMGAKAEPKPEPKPQAPTSHQDAAAQLVSALSSLVTVNPDQIREMVASEVSAAADMLRDSLNKTITVKVEREGRETKEVKGTHQAFPTLLKAVASGCHVFLAGPAGSGKTTAAHQVADALGLPFYFNGAIDTEYKLKGFIDAQGRVVSTAFRKAYETGGVYLFDEVDASMPSATMAFNAALANGTCDFPDGSVTQHKDFICIAAGNTYGMGATFDYVGRNKQDAAFMDRFVTMAWNIDETLERSICARSDWVDWVQAARRRAEDRGLRVVISPRASIFGERLLDAGIDIETVKVMAVRKGMTDDQWNQIKG